MNISRPFIERPVMTLLLMAGLIIFGAFSYASLPVSELPNMDFPTINVRASLPGADPETMASAVATPLESALSGIQGVDSMTSTSSQGSTSITIQFGLDRNIDAAAQDVQAAIASVSRLLPRAMPNPPTIRKIDPAAQPIFFLILTSNTLPISKVDLFARTVVLNQLSTVAGVAQVTVHGPAKYAVRVQADPTALAARSLTLGDLAAAITATSTDQSSGDINGPTKSLIIHTDGQLNDAAAFGRQIVAYRNGAPVTLGDVAHVVDSVQDVRSADWYNDQRAVTLEIQRQPGSDTVQVVDRIKSMLPQFESQLPASIRMHVFYDRSQSILAAINDVQLTLLAAAAMVIGVIFVFLRKARATFVPSLALPVTVLGTFIGMYAFGFGLDNLSLMALTLSVGFVVDDAIVMMENIVRHIEAGDAPYQAALMASEEVGFTIVSMTVSLAAVFIPIVFMGGIVGRLLHEFAMTTVLAVLISGLVSVTLTPMLGAYLLVHEKAAQQGKLYRWSERGFERIRSVYERSLRWCMGHRALVLVVLAASALASGVLFEIMPQDFLPSDDAGQLRGDVQTAVGTSFDQYINYVAQVRRIIERDPNVRGLQSDESGSLVIALKPLSERRLSAQQIATELRAKLDDIPGTRVTIVNPPSLHIGGRTSRSSYQYTLKGLDLTELQDYAQRLMRVLRSDPTFVGVNSDFGHAAPSLEVHIDRGRAAALGISPDQVESTLGFAFGGEQVSQIYAPADQYQVILELLPRYQLDASALSRLYLRGSGTILAPLDAVATVHPSTMPETINHSGQIPAITISFDMAPGKALSDALAGMAKATREIGLPTNIQGAFAGNAAAFQQSTSNMGWLLLVAVLVVYIILGILYESFVHPITILSGLPSAALGALLTLWLFHVPLTLYAFIGMIMLIGIVKKNAIMIIDFALVHQRADGGITPEQAICKAASIRFRPIMMTTLAALMGALPIALGTGMGADSRRPLGLCVAGGLVFSQFLTLYITPVLYTCLEDARKWLGRSAPGERGREAA
ncbi:MAG: efflux RND transporter permease subunit [Xanthomonadaceae bacterium]|nr:efflux RND transporter permease subunit [Xanthomonadaceae bacterium]MDE1963694.1 efflux RND transporter permease subunit [Xanthomonadaceae bacterium]